MTRETYKMLGAEVEVVEESTSDRDQHIEIYLDGNLINDATGELLSWPANLPDLHGAAANAAIRKTLGEYAERVMVSNLLLFAEEQM